MAEYPERRSSGAPDATIPYYPRPSADDGTADGGSSEVAQNLKMYGESLDKLYNIKQFDYGYPKEYIEQMKKSKQGFESALTESEYLDMLSTSELNKNSLLQQKLNSNAVLTESEYNMLPSNFKSLYTKTLTYKTKKMPADYYGRPSLVDMFKSNPELLKNTKIGKDIGNNIIWVESFLGKSPKDIKVIEEKYKNAHKDYNVNMALTQTKIFKNNPLFKEALEEYFKQNPNANKIDFTVSAENSGIDYPIIAISLTPKTQYVYEKIKPTEEKKEQKIDPVPPTKTEEKSYADLARVQPGKELPDDVKAYMSQLALGKPVQFKPVMPTFNADATAQGGIDAPGSTVLRGALQGLTRRLGSEIDYAGFKYGTLKKLEDVYGTTFRQIKPEEYNKVYEPINQKYQQLQAETENLSNLEKQRVELFNAKKDTKELDAQIAEKKIVIAKLQKEVEEGVVRLQSASTFGEEARDPNALIAGTTQFERQSALIDQKQKAKEEYEQRKEQSRREFVLLLEDIRMRGRAALQEDRYNRWMENSERMAYLRKELYGSGYDPEEQDLLKLIQAKADAAQKEIDSKKAQK